MCFCYSRLIEEFGDFVFFAGVYFLAVLVIFDYFFYVIHDFLNQLVIVDLGRFIFVQQVNHEGFDC